MSTIERLRRRPDFLAAADGRRFHTERMTGQGRLRDAAVPDDPKALRVGFTITKRVGHATERNRIRRRLRAAVAAVADDLPSVPADIVLIARRPALDAPFDTLKDDLRRAVYAVVKPRGPDTGARPRRSGKRPDPGGAPDQSIPHGRAAGSPASAASLPQPLPNACGGVPDGQ
ncbi:ribonuclease P protein component [Methylobacterium gregans]|uniref:Ribonuclease P protein component n=1 Tax=Methylobacterium gregans TaxID=374424 RepID=A0AA37MAQ2_9HYPH|nr:ribonuclease P protein component [Methylobacterium gregans]MDQ0520713.1 ribonuclease P protein component [Methylobacterium gregans]GJD78391.1 Ribonuclease P protein component [Methylobacterium gregans]GLS53337.1 ribonuclease P protein component [Methylobacterium gregans]